MDPGFPQQPRPAWLLSTSCILRLQESVWKPQCICPRWRLTFSGHRGVCAWMGSLASTCSLSLRGRAKACSQGVHNTAVPSVPPSALSSALRIKHSLRTGDVVADQRPSPAPWLYVCVHECAAHGGQEQTPGSPGLSDRGLSAAPECWEPNPCTPRPGRN